MNVSLDKQDADHPDLAGLIEQLNAKLEAGDSVDLEHVIIEYPEHAEQLRSLLPAMTALMDLATPASRNNDLRPSDLPNGADTFRRLGDFRIGREIGRGGMGVVYEAEQVSLGRRVALKVLPFAAILDEKCLQRFKNEARAAATLDHPNIVAIYSVGCERAVHFYSMQLIEGRSLAESITQLRSARNRDDGEGSIDEKQQIEPDNDTLADGALSTHGTTDSKEYFRTVAGFGIQVAEALQHAHEMGIVHRDIKPSNLLLDSSGNIWVADFGLAMIQSDIDLTRTGDLVGTLRYMSPEQAAGKRAVVDHRTDVYSLGVTLYEALTLRHAYLATDRQQLLRQIALEEPTRLRRVDRDIPAELETIVHKAMSKDIRQRYSSAQELADDLRSHLENRPIKAKPPTFSEIVSKWASRNPVVFKATAVIAFTLLIATIVSTTFALREYDARQRETTARKRAVRAERQADSIAKHNRRLSYHSDIGLAHQFYKMGDWLRASQLLKRYLPSSNKKDLRDFEWFYLRDVCSSHAVRVLPDKGVVDIAYSPDGRTFATGGADGMIQIWDRETLKPKGSPWSIDPDPHAQHRRLEVTYSPSGEILAGLFRETLGSASGCVILINVNTGDSSSLAHASPESVIQIAFDKDGNRLLTAELNGQVRYWDAATGQPIGAPKHFANGANWRRATFSSDCRLLAAGGPKELKGQPKAPNQRKVQINIYDIATGAIESQLETDGAKLGKLQFTRDSRFLINPGNPPYGYGKLVAWEIKTSKEVFTENANWTYGGAVAVSKDNDIIAVGGPDFILFLSPAKGEIVDRWEGIPGVVSDLAVSPDGTQLASTAWDGMVRFWDYPRKQKPRMVKLTPTPKKLRFSPSGDRLASEYTNSVVLRDTTDFEQTHHLKEQIRPVFSPTGNQLATVSTDRSSIHFWDYLTGDENAPPVSAKHQRIERIAFSRNGDLIAYVTKSGNVFILNMSTRRNHGEFDISSSNARYIAFGVTSNGQDLLAIPEDKRTVKLINLSENRAQILEGPTATITEVAFSADSRQLASCGNNIYVWNTITGEIEHSITESTGVISHIAFSPDGRSILSRGFKQGLSLWDLQSGREKIRFLEEFKQKIQSMSISPDGNQIIAGINNNALMIWSAPRKESATGK